VLFRSIFPLGATAMCAVAGSIACDLSNDSHFDIRDEFKRQAALLSADDFRSAREYLAALLRPIAATITDLGFFPLGNGTADFGDIIAEVIFGVSWGDSVCLDHAVFSHSNNIAQAGFLEYKEGGAGKTCYGPDAIYNLMYEEPGLPAQGSPLSQYAYRLSTTPSVGEVKKFDVGYIEACCSQEGRKLDPDGCEGIGGHIHVATVKPRSGFQWIIPPLPEEEA
jgi:hypothetical protein